MQSTPVSMARTEALEQFAHRLGVADGRLQDAGGRLLQAGQGQRFASTSPSGCWFSSMIEIDVAQAVVAVDLGRSAAEGQLATLPIITGPCLPGTVRRSSSESPGVLPAAA
jgi:hypothetical protein